MIYSLAMWLFGCLVASQVYHRARDANLNGNPIWVELRTILATITTYVLCITLYWALTQ